MAVPQTNKVELLFWEDGAFNWYDPDADGPQTVLTGVFQTWVDSIALNSTNVGRVPQIVNFPNFIGGPVPSKRVDGWQIAFPSAITATSTLSVFWEGNEVPSGNSNGFRVYYGGWNNASDSRNGYGDPEAPYITDGNLYVNSYRELSVLVASSSDNGQEFLAMTLRAGDRAGSNSNSNSSEVSFMVFKDQNGEWMCMMDYTTTIPPTLAVESQSGSRLSIGSGRQEPRYDYNGNQTFGPLMWIHQGEGSDIPGQKLWMAANQYLYWPSYMPSNNIRHGTITGAPGEAFIGLGYGAGEVPVVRYRIAD